MSETFKATYPSTTCLIDCTEIFYQKSSSLSCQCSLYSRYSIYKYHVTYKGLVGIASPGAITISFISELYIGSISDKESVRKNDVVLERWRDRKRTGACILCNFFPPLIRKNSTAVNNVWKYHKNVIILYFLTFRDFLLVN